MTDNKASLLQVTSDCMGTGNDELGALLLTNYFRLISNDELEIKIICFYNSGVKLLCDSSPCYSYLKIIQDKGVKLLACKTCVDFFEIQETISLGSIGSMQDIITLQYEAKKIINL